MSEVVLGPTLRHAQGREATLWLQTDRPGTVEVAVGDDAGGGTASTFTVEDHHYAIVVLEGLTPGAREPYSVRLDDEQVWPLPDQPPSTIRTAPPGGPVRIAFGSCLAQAPQERPWTASRRDDRMGLGPDALRTLGLEVLRDADRHPDALLLLGDQVYADAAAPELREEIARRRDIDEPPGTGVADFREYAELYRRTWSEPTIRWLLSSTPTSMIFDDHEIIDDWNISESWVSDIRRTSWWEQRITSGLAAYWVYEHLGNLPPDEIRSDPMLRDLCRADDGSQMLLEAARSWDRGTTGTTGARWSYRRDIGDVTVLVIDSRNGRVLDPGRRRMIDDEEQAWLQREMASASGHVLLASSVPWLLPPGVHDVEGWNEAVADGAWGALAARVAESLRRALDLEHWAAFRASWTALAQMIRETSRRPDVSSVLMLSGDVHYSYAAPLQFDDGPHAPVWQLVSSPLRYPTPSSLERAFDLASTTVASVLGSRLARLARLAPPGASWELTVGPIQHNGVAELHLADRARVTYSGAIGEDEPRLEEVVQLDLA